MEMRVRQRRNAHRGIVSMAFVVVLRARKRVELVRLRKKAVGMMEFVGRLQRALILTTNA